MAGMAELGTGLFWTQRQAKTDLSGRALINKRPRYEPVPTTESEKKDKMVILCFLSTWLHRYLQACTRRLACMRLSLQLLAMQAHPMHSRLSSRCVATRPP